MKEAAPVIKEIAPAVEEKAVVTPLVFDAGQQLGQPDSDARAPFLRVGPDGRLYAIWTKKETHAVDNVTLTAPKPGMAMPKLRAVFMNSSADDGRTWSGRVIVNDGNPMAIEGEEGLPKIAVARDGRIYIV